MAKKDKNKENKVSTDESTGSKIVTVLIVLVIVVIWLAIFGVLINPELLPEEQVKLFLKLLFHRDSTRQLIEQIFAGTGTESE